MNCPKKIQAILAGSSLWVQALVPATHASERNHTVPEINISFNGEVEKVSVTEASEGPDALNLGPFLGKYGLKNFDPGLQHTATTISGISFINGPEGLLSYRNRPIESLISHDYPDVAYLLIYGSLPSDQAKEEFHERLEFYNRSYASWREPSFATPMPTLARQILALADRFPGLAKGDLSQDEKDEVIALLLSQFRQNVAGIRLNHPTVKNKVTISQRIRALLRAVVMPGYHFLWPAPKHTGPKSYAREFTEAAFPRLPEESLKVVSDAINLLLILHAEHGQNCSTSTVRMVTSAKASPFAAVAAGIQALSGSAHGRANEDVIRLLQNIQNEIREKAGDDPIRQKAVLPDVVRTWTEKAKSDKSFRLPGFGHRVYKNFDPRAKIIKETSDRLLKQLNKRDLLLDIASELEAQALADNYFVKRKLYPNVDFYSGIIYRALDIPDDMMTVMFAFGRVSGWLAHWKEMTDTGGRIWRPAQVYRDQNFD